MELNKREKVVSYALERTRKDITMGKAKYSEDMKLQTVKYVLEGGKSATNVSKELGIDTNTV
jgi:transposase-like protein